MLTISILISITTIVTMITTTIIKGGDHAYESLETIVWNPKHCMWLNFVCFDKCAFAFYFPHFLEKNNNKKN